MSSIYDNLSSALNGYVEVITLLEEWRLESEDQVLSKDTIHPFLEMRVIFFEKNKTRRKYFKERLVVSSLTTNAFF